MSELPEVDPRPSKLEKGSYDDVLVIPQSLANQVEAQQEYISKNRKVSIEDTRSSKVCFRYQGAEFAWYCRVCGRGGEDVDTLRLTKHDESHLHVQELATTYGVDLETLKITSQCEGCHQVFTGSEKYSSGLAKHRKKCPSIKAQNVAAPKPALQPRLIKPRTPAQQPLLLEGIPPPPSSDPKLFNAAFFMPAALSGMNLPPPPPEPVGIPPYPSTNVADANSENTFTSAVTTPVSSAPETPALATPRPLAFTGTDAAHDTDMACASRMAKDFLDVYLAAERAAIPAASGTGMPGLLNDIVSAQSGSSLNTQDISLLAHHQPGASSSLYPSMGYPPLDVPMVEYEPAPDASIEAGAELFEIRELFRQT
ncbi:hypothetical protein PHLGIDRAFT_204149 [Phlebiopsis gigantea 11061_1 CR5-6]|uniref:Uncharacterized protein n=1 Tax=Phlebiopsis gigantea (strain 11061_1 CR5-6) TaxID=745531 RepID=A0A0C3S359_PHLG1|nr:hypothetical protein PHLGIDRAFT_204149 [Phlebiopsis gigantea 11061_1 CR5-6]